MRAILLAHQHEARVLVGDRERMAVHAIAGADLPFEVQHAADRVVEQRSYDVEHSEGDAARPNWQHQLREPVQVQWPNDRALDEQSRSWPHRSPGRAERETPMTYWPARSQ